MNSVRRKSCTTSSSDSPMSSPDPPTPPTPSFASTTGPARPIRLVYCDEKGKFQMDPEAVAMLRLLKEPLGVVAVCGRPRQGKSFILNQLLGRSSGFQVASTCQRCTKGLWLWSAPIRRTALDGTEYNLLLLDSEGIGAYDQTNTYSTQIFSLVLLLSSMFLYNQRGLIDESDLDRLSFVTEMTKHIRVRASGGRSTASELGQSSPILVWLLRDFYLTLIEDDREITPRDYLELALRPVKGSGRDWDALNEIRESIRASFPDRECFTLVRPSSKDEELRRLDQIPLDTLLPKFRDGVDALTKFVFERTRPKQLGEIVMTGPILAHVTQFFLDAINAGAVPTIPPFWQDMAPWPRSLPNPVFPCKVSTIDPKEIEQIDICRQCSRCFQEIECLRAYKLAKEVYRSTFDRSTAFEEAALWDVNEEAVRKTLAAFNDKAIGDGSIRQNYEKLLQSFLKKDFENRTRDALKEAYLQCSNAIQNTVKELRTACHALEATIDVILKAAEGKIKNNDPEILTLKLKLREVGEMLDAVNASAKSVEREARIWKLEWVHLEKKYRSELDNFKEVRETCKTAERKAKCVTELAYKVRAEAVAVAAQREKNESHRMAMESLAQLPTALRRMENLERHKNYLASEAGSNRTTESADEARAGAVPAQREKNESQWMKMERLAQIERTERLIENLERQKKDLASEAESYRLAESDAASRVELLESRVERAKEIESLFKSNKQQWLDNVEVLQSLLETERATLAEYKHRAEALSVQLQATQGKLDSLQQRLNQLNTASRDKRSRFDDHDEMGFESVHEEMDTDDDRVGRGNKRSRSSNSPLKKTTPRQAEDGDSVFERLKNTGKRDYVDSYIKNLLSRSHDF